MAQFLHAQLLQSIVAGERLVYLYEISKDIISNAQSQLKNVVLPNSILSKRYPLPISQEQHSLELSNPVLCDIKFSEQGDISLVFCSIRAFDDRTTYQYSELSEIVQRTYGNIEKLVTFRRIYYQAYDVINVRVGLERLEICIDQPSKISKKELDLLPTKMLSICASFMPSLVHLGITPPLNLFPAIDAMYQNKNEGQVKILAFRTLTGSSKRETMPSSSEDLRDEKFHHGGMNAVDQKIYPYEIEIFWDFKIPVHSAASLRLAALIKEISSATPTLHACFVHSTSSTGALQVLNKLVSYLSVTDSDSA